MESKRSVSNGHSLITGLVLIVIAINYKIQRTVKYYLKYSAHLLYVQFISIVGIPLMLYHPCSSKSAWIYCSLMNPISYILGIEWEIRNASNILGDNHSAVFISNHQTIFDVVGMVRLWHLHSVRCVGLSRNLFFWLWPHGLAMWLIGTVFIKRTSTPEKRIRRLNQAAQEIFHENGKLWIFVEGTRNKNNEKLLPFKKGAYRVAIDHQVPIIPVVFSPQYFIDSNEKRFDSGICIMDVLQPIPTEGLTVDDLDDLVQRSYATMSAKYQQLRDEIQSRIAKHTPQS